MQVSRFNKSHLAETRTYHLSLFQRFYYLQSIPIRETVTPGLLPQAVTRKESLMEERISLLYFTKAGHPPKRTERYHDRALAICVETTRN